MKNIQTTTTALTLFILHKAWTKFLHMEVITNLFTYDRLHWHRYRPKNHFCHSDRLSPATIKIIHLELSTLKQSHSWQCQRCGFIFDEHLTFCDQITSLSKAYYYHIRQLCCIQPYLDSSTACTITTSIVHSKLYHCNSLYYKLPKSQLSRLQQIQNSLARTFVKAPKSCHITPIPRSLHWFRITECIEYKLLSLTNNVPTTTQPPYLHNLISVQRPSSTRSSSVVTLARHLHNPL